MKLSSDKLFFSIKKAGLLSFCVLIFINSFAGNPPMYEGAAPTYNRTPLDETTAAVNYPGSEIDKRVEQAPMSYPGVNSDKPGATYVGLYAPIEKYYDTQVNIYGNLNGKHEENYVYSDGRHETNYYSGVLGRIIKDFDNDTMPEMALFRIRTTEMAELATKEIVLEMVRILNGVATMADSLVISTEIFDGEDIEVNAGVKEVDGMQRIFFDYFEHRVLSKEYRTRFLAIDYPNTINIISELNFSGVEDEGDLEGGYEFRDQVLDAGIVLHDDTNVFKKNFLNDDVNLTPIFTIKRVNESMEEGFLENYMDTHFDELNKNGFVKVRYGYTSFIDRTVN